MAETTNGATAGDDEAKRLKAELEVLEARARLTAARTGALSALAPGVTDGPTGQVTVGEKAGALGPWLAHRVVACVASQIAAAVDKVMKDAKEGQGAARRVLVTADVNLLATDVQATVVRTSLTERSTELGRVTAAVQSAARMLRTAVDAGAGDAEEPLPESPGFAGTGARTDSSEEEDSGTGASAGSPLGAAVELVRLTATDYGVSAIEVSADAALLVTLTAAALGGSTEPACRPVIDGFDVARPTRRTLTALSAVRAGVTRLAEETLALRQLVAPHAARLAHLEKAVVSARAAWSAADTGEDAATPEQVAALRKHLDELTDELARCEAAVGPAREVLETAAASLAAARAEMVATTTPDSGGVSPLARACARELLDAETGREVTHVLHVRPTQVAADMVTRRSLLGSSGRVSYLGSASAAWVLLDVQNGTLTGGAQHKAKQVVHDLETGTAWSWTGGVVQAQGAPRRADPLVATERAMRAAVVVLALGVALLGVVATLRLVLS